MLRRIGVLLLGTAGTAALAFATQLLLTRGMSVADYGRLAALLAAVNVLTPVATLGMGWFWLTLFGREGWRATRWIAPAMRVSALASLVAAALLALYVVGAPSSAEYDAMRVFVLLLPVLMGQSLAETTASKLQLEERYWALAAWQLLTQLGRSLVVGLFVFGSVAITRLLGGYACVGVLTATISLVAVLRMRRGRFALVGHGAFMQPLLDDTPPTLTQVVREAAPYGLITLFYLVYSQGLVALVHVLLGSNAAAAYNVAFLVTTAVYLIPNVVYTKFLAGKLLRWWSHDRGRFVAVFHLGVTAHAVMGLALAVLIAGAARWFVPSMFGAQYAATVPVLAVLAIGIPLRFVQHAYGSVLFSNEHVNQKIRCMGAAALASVLLTLALTPAFGVQGAAAAAGLSELLLLALYVRVIVRHVEGIDVLGGFRPAVLRRSLRAVLHPNEEASARPRAADMGAPCEQR